MSEVYSQRPSQVRKLSYSNIQLFGKGARSMKKIWNEINWSSEIPHYPTLIYIFSRKQQNQKIYINIKNKYDCVMYQGRKKKFNFIFFIWVRFMFRLSCPCVLCFICWKISLYFYMCMLSVLYIISRKKIIIFLLLTFFSFFFFFWVSFFL